MKLPFGIVPLEAGFAKCKNQLTQREQYINPIRGNMLPFSGHTV